MSSPLPLPAIVGLLLLSISAFAASLWLFSRSDKLGLAWLHPLLHPLVTGSAVIAAALWLLDIPYWSYKAANWPLIELLGPATVALAVPLQREFHLIRQMAKPLLAGLFFGSFISTITALVFASLAGGSEAFLLAASTKTVTTPIALGIAEKIAAEPGLVAGIVIFTGVVGAVAASPMFRLLGISDHRVQGFALGINAHGVGTARAFEISPTCGAFASLAMSLTGAMVALILPWMILAAR